MPLDPLEALDLVIDRSCTLLHHTLHLGPGGVVQRQEPEVREALQQLTSKVTRDQRVDPLMASGPFWHPDPFQQEMLVIDHHDREHKFGWLKNK